MNKILLSPTCLYEFEWDLYDTYKQDLIDYCYELKAVSNEIAVAPGAKKLMFESNFNFLSDNRSAVSALNDFFYKSLWTVIPDMNQHRWTDQPRGISITESWCHITDDGGFHDIHSHGGASWCGIFYLDPAKSNVESRSGVNRFYSNLHLEYHDEGNRYMDSYFDCEPVAGKLVVFPAHLQHSALPYQGEDARLVVSFNAQARTI